MELNEIKYRLTGVFPLLMHNGQLADPMNKWAKELSKYAKGKSKDLIEARRIEFLGSLYLDDKKRPCLTADMVYSCIIEGAKARKMGKAAKAAVVEAAPTFALEYDGPKDPIKLFEHGEFGDYRGVRVGNARVMRSRPIFRGWSAEIAVLLNDGLMSLDELDLAVERAGLACGLGDYRPRFGRFKAERL